MQWQRRGKKQPAEVGAQEFKQVSSLIPGHDSAKYGIRAMVVWERTGIGNCETLFADPKQPVQMKGVWYHGFANV